MNFIQELKDKVAEYLDVHVKLIKLNFIESIAKIFGYFIFVMMGSLLGFAILIYLGLALAEWFTVLANGSRIAGFFMTVGAYLLLAVFLYLLRKPLIKTFSGKVIKLLTENTDQEDK